MRCKLQEDLIEKVEAASHSWLARKQAPVHSLPIPASGFPVSGPVNPQLGLQQTPRPVPRIIVLGTSTGGPQALQGLLPELPGDLPVAMIVVQHMPPGLLRP
jgi:two-component system, chemotaxis family, protein-glutamate methylesterase/glutaminase